MDEISQSLGRIEGKLDQALREAHEHRDDDNRRFAHLYGKMEEHAKEINMAKGAKGAITMLASTIGAVVAFIVTMLAKAFGIHQ